MAQMLLQSPNLWQAFRTLRSTVLMEDGNCTFSLNLSACPSDPLAKALGRVPTPQMYTMKEARYYLSDEFQVVVNDKQETLNAMEDFNTEKLWNLSTPSKFGHGTETKFDETVRCAREMPAQLLHRASWSPLIKSACENIDLRIFGNSLSIVPYKLQIYGPGGHFAPHRDTLHTDTHVGTLLIAFPTQHKGGTLVLELPKSKPATIEWKTDQLNRGAKSHNQYSAIAFFTDVVHSVKPVATGYRVVLQCEIYRTEGHPSAWHQVSFPEVDFNSEDERGDGYDEIFNESDPNLPLPLSNDHCRSVLLNTAHEWKDNLAQAANHIYEQKGMLMGIVLEHLYGWDNLQQQMLKGADAARAEALQMCGYKTWATPVCIATCRYEDESSATPNCVDVKIPCESWPEDADDLDLHIVVVRTPIAVHMLDMKPGAQLTGNEAAPEERQYGAGLMVVYKPDTSRSASPATEALAEELPSPQPSPKRRKIE